MRIVAGEAVRLLDRLALVGFDDLRVLGIVAFRAERGAGLGQVMAELGVRRSARLVGDVAGFAAAIERGVAAAPSRDIQPLSVALQPSVAFSNWFLKPETCGSWHLRQSRTAGLWT